MDDIARLLDRFNATRLIRLSHMRPFLSIPSLVHTNEYATAANVYFLLDFAFSYLKVRVNISLIYDS